jgi:hypothetical protein
MFISLQQLLNDFFLPRSAFDFIVSIGQQTMGIFPIKPQLCTPKGSVRSTFLFLMAFSSQLQSEKLRHIPGSFFFVSHSEYSAKNQG